MFCYEYKFVYYICLHVPILPFSISTKRNIPLSKTYTKLQHKVWVTKHIYQITICPPTNTILYVFMIIVQRKSEER